MISINASTKHSVKKKVVKKVVKKNGKAVKTGKSKSRGMAPPLKPKSFASEESLSALASLSVDDLQSTVDDILRQALGGSPALFGAENGIAAPRTASTTQVRGRAAADLASIVKSKGLIQILKTCGVLDKIEQNLIPTGIASLFGNENGLNPGGGMRKIASKLSLASMGSIGSDSFDMGSTIVSDSRRGKTIPPEAREGCLLILRALAEIVGKASEPFVVPLLAAALEECSSSSSFVREAAEDSAKSILSLTNGHAIPTLVCPVLFEALHSPEWRVKAAAMEKLSECADLHPRQISRMLPEIVPVITSQVWDTKPQVTKAAKDCLLACCLTNINPDVAPAVPAIVTAICKPNDTTKAIDELKATTFVASVDSSTLSILCPVLSRGLKDRLAINKRSCCVVIENMSRLVETPEAVAPFGPLLVPDLKKVADNVQFEEIRDAALAALGALTKALGHSSIDEAVSSVMKDESERVAAEQKRIDDHRAAEEAREEENRKREEEERKEWKEAMEAQRLLNELALKEEAEKKAEEKKEKELAKKSVKSSGGKCQSCGLKKCKKSCLFYSK